MNIGERIRDIRKQHNINQTQLASVLKEFYGLGTDRVAISKWETGFQLPNVEAIRCIADYFNVSADFFIKDDTGFQSKNVIPLYKKFPQDNCDGCIRGENGATMCVISPDDSMLGAGIKEGANVFVTETTDVQNGNIVLAKADDKGYIRRFYKNGNIVVLASENMNFPPLAFDSNKIEIIGKIRCVYFAFND